MKRATAIIFRSLILVLLGVAIGLFVSTRGQHGFIGNNKVAKVLQLVRHNYVDSVNADSIEGVAVNNLLQNLDPHSLYLPPQQAESVNERLDGGFNGIGIEYQLLRDTLYITQVYDKGPAMRAGIAPGDRVINVFERCHRRFGAAEARLPGGRPISQVFSSCTCALCAGCVTLAPSAI